ncbi:pleckstrin homology domain-containing family G member 2 isoform X2 [Phycodurus eques]|uniref:pleckstrin homology domain-containing family G member 2 isoform X2 n=1 Tax=Phycodurus eques TaxID=693459 RepID=UPI002ACEA9E5|nr:pleckstrin homology domain-containing family G member 2 isoform X2 [Phycodurus eques]
MCIFKCVFVMTYTNNCVCVSDLVAFGIQAAAGESKTPSSSTTARLSVVMTILPHPHRLAPPPPLSLSLSPSLSLIPPSCRASCSERLFRPRRVLGLNSVSPLTPVVQPRRPAGDGSFFLCAVFLMLFSAPLLRVEAHAPDAPGRGRAIREPGAKRPSSVSSLRGMASSGERGASTSCASVDTVCSDRERPASLSLSSSASSASLRDASRSSSSSSSSSSLPYGAVPAYDASSPSSSAPERNGSDISLDLTPLLAGGGARAAAPGPGRPSRLERVVMEIVETEQAYVRDLKSIVEDYLGCIIDCGALPLNPEQVSSLFCNIEDIYEFNSELLEDLERSQHAAAIADCFVERSEAFDIYTLYCMNYPTSVSVLRECMKNPGLVRFFQERQATLNHSLPLETYLLKPVQRILKYHLLLQELAKHSDKSEPGYAAVEDAIITMTAVAWYINDMKRKQEHAVRLQEIESLLVNWSGPDLSGFGELVLESSFKVHKVKKERAFFLFDKMLLIAKKRVERFVYSTHIFCCNLLLADTLKDPLCFRVSDLMIPKQQHVVQSKNMEEKRLWVHYLKKLILENHPASLPHKARQVLGDNCCQSPQFDREHLKTFSCASPRLDNIHAHHRGRRQSEPPELLTYTPEKSRKSLPPLLEGNLPYRRTRRRSAPAKDIDAAFSPPGE